MGEMTIKLDNGVELGFTQMNVLHRLLQLHKGRGDATFWHPNECGCCVTLHGGDKAYVIDRAGEYDEFQMLEWKQTQSIEAVELTTPDGRFTVYPGGWDGQVGIGDGECWAAARKAVDGSVVEKAYVRTIEEAKAWCMSRALEPSGDSES